jgi:hypothetical protein
MADVRQGLEANLQERFPQSSHFMINILLDVMERCGVVLTGSTALQVIRRLGPWDQSDIDLLLDQSHIQHEHDIILSLTRGPSPYRVRIYDVEQEPVLEVADYRRLRKYIRRIYSLEANGLPAIQVIVTNRSIRMTEDFLNTFDLTANRFAIGTAPSGEFISIEGDVDMPKLERRELHVDVLVMKLAGVRDWVRTIRRIHKYMLRGFTLTRKDHLEVLCEFAETCQLNPFRAVEFFDIVTKYEGGILPKNIISINVGDRESNVIVLSHPDGVPTFHFFTPTSRREVVAELPRRCHDMESHEEIDIGKNIVILVEGSDRVTCYPNLEMFRMSITYIRPCHTMDTELMNMLSELGKLYMGQPRLVTLQTITGPYVVPSGMLWNALKTSHYIMIKPAVAAFDKTISEVVIEGGNGVGELHCQDGSDKSVHIVVPV